MVPHFLVKWNSPLKVFIRYKGGTLSTQSNQANYHKLGRVLNFPPLSARCKMQNANQEDLQEGVMGLRSKVRSGINLGSVELDSLRLGSKKNTSTTNY